MQNKRNQNQKLMNQIYKNNYILEIKSNTKGNQNNFQMFSPQSRGKTPIYTRVKNLLNIETNNINNINNPKQKEEYDLYSASNNSSNNNIFNNVLNKTTNLNNNNVNNTVNYTMRGSNYSNYSGSGFTTMTN